MYPKIFEAISLAIPDNFDGSFLMNKKQTVHSTIGRFLIVGSRDQVICTLLPSRQWDSSPLLDHVTQLSG
jgi:hypothetical protein